MSMIDRWKCRRKVTGALEAAEEPWEGRGWLGCGEHRSHSRSCHAAHTNRFMHRYQHANLCFSYRNQHQGKNIMGISTQFLLCTEIICKKHICWERYAQAHRHWIIGEREPPCLLSSSPGSLSSVNYDSCWHCLDGQWWWRGMLRQALGVSKKETGRGCQLVRTKQMARKTGTCTEHKKEDLQGNGWQELDREENICKPSKRRKAERKSKTVWWEGVNF